MHAHLHRVDLLTGDQVRDGPPEIVALLIPTVFVGSEVSRLGACSAMIDSDQGSAPGHDISIDGSAAPCARPAASGPAFDIAIEDWEVLLTAVKDRLRLTVGERLAAPTEPQVHDESARVRTSVLESVAALDHLHTTLAHELARLQQFAPEVSDTQITLARVRAEPAVIQSSCR
jgi:hypothetical protein